MENNFYAKPMYKCGVCGSTYEDVLARAKCEIACTEKKEEEERKAAEAKKAAEYDARLEEVNNAFENAYKLRDKLIADYGDYHHSKIFDSLDSVFEALFGV